MNCRVPKNFYHLALFVLMSLPCFSGCTLIVGAAAGAGGVAYVMGSVEKEVLYPVAEVHEATLFVLKDRDIYVYYEDRDSQAGEIKGEFPDRERIKVNVIARTPESTRIRIRIGTFGDKMRSLEILEAIEREL